MIERKIRQPLPDASPVVHALDKLAPSPTIAGHGVGRASEVLDTVRRGPGHNKGESF